MLFGCYRRGDANDPETYVAAISAVLASYEPEIVREVTDPRTGIMTSEKYMSFMPNAGELKVYCEAIAARRERFNRMASLPPPAPRLPPPPPQQGERAKVFVPDDHPRYAGLVEWSQNAEPKWWHFGRSSDGRSGIWIPHGVWDRDPAFCRSIGSGVANLIGSLAEAAE
ncbi:hypothetical protein [Bradyrhizobium cenepequi]